MKTVQHSKVQAIEEEFGLDLVNVLISVYHQERNLKGVAMRLGVSQSTISNWMVRCGLVIETHMQQYWLTERGQQILADSQVGQGGHHEEN